VGSLGTPFLALIFVAAAAATWVAGIYLSRTTDAIDARLGLGEALGGMILLAIAGSLPELAVTVSGALQHNFALVAGNLLGGIAMQTLVMVICDFVVVGDRPLSHLVGSLVPVLEASMVIMVVSVVLMGTLLPSSVALFGVVSPASIMVVFLWLLGVVVLNEARKTPRWKASAPGSRPGRPHRRAPHPSQPHPFATASMRRVVLIFLGGCGATLVAGVLLELTGNELANRAHMNGVIFGATVLALATGLPEISTGIAAVRLGDHQLVMSDIFGGNAFQVCLFLLADIVAGRPVLPSVGRANSWLAGVGIVLTAVYGGAVVLRPQRRFARLGGDSITVVLLFAIGVLGLLAVTH
jgi:cation:H+ antiporter